MPNPPVVHLRGDRLARPSRRRRAGVSLTARMTGCELEVSGRARRGVRCRLAPRHSREARMNRLVVALVMLAVAVGTAAGQSPTVICYNCPPEWADWASQLKAIKEATGITVPHDNKNSGQSLSQLIAEKARPVADVTYLGVTFGIQAKKDGVVASYKPAHWAEIPDGLKDAEGYWFTIHSGT